MDGVELWRLWGWGVVFPGGGDKVVEGLDQLAPARHAQLASRTPPSPRTYASAAAYLNKLAAQYLNADE